MQFIDHARIVIKAGNGGDGCVAFHREKYVAQGGPSGGDGGKGGDLIFVADQQLSTLLDFKFQRFYRAENGEPGKAKLSTGRDGAPLIVRVPVGTVVRDVETGAILADLNENGKERVLLRGGYGGKGNARFPRLAGQHQAYTLKQLADYKSGRRATDPLMTTVGKRLSAEEAKALAEYIAGL